MEIRTKRIVINRPNVKKKKVFFFTIFFSQNHRFAIAIVTNIVKKLEKNTDFPILKKNFVCKIKDLQNFFFPNNYEQWINEDENKKKKRMINRLNVKKKIFYFAKTNWLKL